MSSSGTFISPGLRDQEQLTPQHVTPDGRESTVHRAVHAKRALGSGDRHHTLQYPEPQWDEDPKVDYFNTPAIDDNASGRENRFNGRPGAALAKQPSFSFKDTTIGRRKGR